MCNLDLRVSTEHLEEGEDSRLIVGVSLSTDVVQKLDDHEIELLGKRLQFAFMRERDRALRGDTVKIDGSEGRAKKSP